MFCLLSSSFFFFFFFNDTATTEIYTLSLHDALPICLRTQVGQRGERDDGLQMQRAEAVLQRRPCAFAGRSEEHTSELQSLTNLVCRLLLEKKKKKHRYRRGHELTSCVQAGLSRPHRL